MADIFSILNDIWGRSKKTEQVTDISAIDKKSADSTLSNEFGGRITFSSYESKPLDFPVGSLIGERLSGWEQKYRNITIRIHGENKGRKSMSLTLYIPTFDSGDRESDSWRRLYLFQGDEKGVVDGIYATGGYHVGFVMYCHRLKTAPFKIRKLLKEAGVTGNHP